MSSSRGPTASASRNCSAGGVRQRRCCPLPTLGGDFGTGVPALHRQCSTCPDVPRSQPTDPTVAMLAAQLEPCLSGRHAEFVSASCSETLSPLHKSQQAVLTCMPAAG